MSQFLVIPIPQVEPCGRAASVIGTLTNTRGMWPGCSVPESGSRGRRLPSGSCHTNSASLWSVVGGEDDEGRQR